MPRLIPTQWMPECAMRRIVTHWTAGSHHANPGDREHYHFLIEADGHLVRGDHPVDDNVSTQDDDYAAHTFRLNTGSIGVAVCCMAGAIRQPFRAGEFPMTKGQYEAMAVAVADLCERYHIAPAPQTVLGHGEVEENLDVPQAGKWDPMVLPWDETTLDPRATRRVGDEFRRKVQLLLEGPAPIDNRPAPDSEEPAAEGDLAPVTVVLDEKPMTDEGLLEGGASWAPLRPLADAQGWTILRIDPQSALIDTGSRLETVDAMIRGDRGFVKIRALCEHLGWDRPSWDAASRTVSLRSKSAEDG